MSEGVILAPTHGYKGLPKDSVDNVEKNTTDAVITKLKRINRTKKIPQNIPEDFHHKQFTDLRVIHEGNENAMERRRYYLKKQDLRAHYNGVAFPQTDAENLKFMQGINKF